MSSNERVALALLIHTLDRPGVLHALTGIILEHRANIKHVDVSERGDGLSDVYFELEDVSDAQRLIDDFRSLEIVREIEEPPAMNRLFGKRIIVMGGGAQVGQVALGAIAEADRHNIRGERISVDTIPLVGEQNLAAAVLGVARLPRVRALVLAGSLMGGEITNSVRQVRERGIIVVSLNMVGSVRDAADIVVTDPVQAGVMTVMAIADTAKFDIKYQRGRRY